MLKLICLLPVLTIFSCGTTKTKQDAGMQGVYNMLSQSFKGASTDTTFTKHKQLKIYADNYMMYVRFNSADSVCAFGIGTYMMDSGRVTQNIIYSATDTMENTNLFSGTVNIARNDKDYQQVIPEIMSDKGKIKLTEEYKSIGENKKSPLDGAWEQTVPGDRSFDVNIVMKGNDKYFQTMSLPGGNKFFAEFTRPKKS